MPYDTAIAFTDEVLADAIQECCLSADMIEAGAAAILCKIGGANDINVCAAKLAVQVFWAMQSARDPQMLGLSPTCIA